jgi:hypothetical protein
VIITPKRKTRSKPMATRVAPLPMDNIMVDLETLGRRAGCSILSIGVVAFCPDSGKLGDELYIVVQRKSCVEAGLHEDDDTLRWWAGQTEAARQVLIDAETSKKAVPLDKALEQLSAFITHHGGKNAKVWGNGADFDNAILTACYAAVKQTQPWDFWNNRCYRTLKSLVRGPKLQRVGTYHNALDDAKSQALHAIELLNCLQA